MGNRPRLTDDEVRAIHKDPRSIQVVAEHHGVTRNHVYLIKAGKVHLDLQLGPTRKYAEMLREKELMAEYAKSPPPPLPTRKEAYAALAARESWIQERLHVEPIDEESSSASDDEDFSGPLSTVYIP